LLFGFGWSLSELSQFHYGPKQVVSSRAREVGFALDLDVSRFDPNFQGLTRGSGNQKAAVFIVKCSDEVENQDGFIQLNIGI
jgi:hypothetical protein